MTRQAQLTKSDIILAIRTEVKPIVDLVALHETQIRANTQTLNDPTLGLVAAHKKNTDDIQNLKDGRGRMYGISGGLGFITGFLAAWFKALTK